MLSTLFKMAARTKNQRRSPTKSRRGAKPALARGGSARSAPSKAGSAGKATAKTKRPVGRKSVGKKPPGRKAASKAAPKPAAAVRKVTARAAAARKAGAPPAKRAVAKGKAVTTRARPSKPSARGATATKARSGARRTPKRARPATRPTAPVRNRQARPVPAPKRSGGKGKAQARANTARERERLAKLNAKAKKERERLAREQARVARERARLTRERAQAKIAAAKERERLSHEQQRRKAAAAKEKARLAKERERERAQAAKEKARLAKERERERAQAAKEKARLAKERARQRAELEAAQRARQAKAAAEREAAKKAREEERRRQAAARVAEREAAKKAREEERLHQQAERDRARDEERRAKEEERTRKEKEREEFRRAKLAERERLRAERESARRALEGKIARANRQAQRAGGLGGRGATARLYRASAIPDQSGTTRRVEAILAERADALRAPPTPAEALLAVGDPVTTDAELAPALATPPPPYPTPLPPALDTPPAAPASETAAAAAGTLPSPDNVAPRYASILDRLGRSEDEFQRAYRESFEMSWIYHDSAMEGVVYTFQELKTAIDPNIAVVPDSSLQPVCEEIRRHKAAIDYVRDLAEKRRTPITVDTVRKIYLILHPEEGDLKSVKYRKDIPQHRLYFHEYAAPDKINYRVRQVIDWLNGPEPKKIRHPVRIAARMHFDLVRVFPFAVDSGKVARLLMNLVLLRSDYPPAIIHSTERQRYYEALKGALPVIVQMVNEAIENGLQSIEKKLDEQETRKRTFGG